jgi:transglutaminase/protease-like cytokinesis protein 3
MFQQEQNNDVKKEYKFVIPVERRIKKREVIIEKKQSFFDKLGCIYDNLPSLSYLMCKTNQEPDIYDLIRKKVKTIHYSDYQNKRVRSLWCDSFAIGDMARQIVLDLEKDELKVYAIFAWIVYHIKYDYAGIKDNAYVGKQNVYDLVKNSEGVCDGYANLFSRLCYEVGIKNNKIVGITKPIRPDSVGHAWNDVYYDGRWHLMDSCWGWKYYDVKPEIMIKNHFPNAEIYQHLEVKVKRNDFIR